MRVKSQLTEDVIVSSDKDIVLQFIEELQSHQHSQDEFLEDAIKINKLLHVADQRVINNEGSSIKLQLVEFVKQLLTKSSDVKQEPAVS